VGRLPPAARLAQAAATSKLDRLKTPAEFIVQQSEDSQTTQAQGFHGLTQSGGMAIRWDSKGHVLS